MALVVSTLQSDILAAFQSMTDGDNEVFAEKVARAFDKYAESGVIATADAGGIAAGAFTGAGNGGVTCDFSVCKDVIAAACNTMNDMKVGGNEYLAAQIALGAHSMVQAGEVNTTVTGAVTPPGSSPVPMSGKAKGTTAGIPAPMQASLQAAFTLMDKMSGGGDEYMAQSIAQAFDAYLKAALVSTSGSGNLAGSAGTGKMT
jgi:hypothetical protein